MTTTTLDLAASVEWHLLEPLAAAEALDISPDRGLDEEQVAERQARFGRNELDEPPPRPAWKRFVDQFRSVLVLILVGAAVLAAAVGDVKDPIVIGVVLVLNAILGFLQEGQAARALAALKDMMELRVRVRRDGLQHEVQAADLVPGDIVLLEAGDRVPADGRLMVASAVSADESMLTGESVPSDKDIGALPGEVALGDRHNELFMNTTLVRGRAELLVTRTGMGTEVGRIAGLLNAEVPRTTPLERQLHRLGTRLAMVAGVAVTVVFALNLARGETFSDALLASVALAVAAVPEGLTAVVTVTLALGVRHMARRNAIVKRLPSVETLGSTSVICSDKTGTLTLNEMTAVRLVHGNEELEVSGLGYDPADGAIAVQPLPPSLSRSLQLAALCNDASIRSGSLVGDPTEGALAVLAAKGGIDVDGVRRSLPRLAELPFDSATKLMATVHEDDDGPFLAVKGAPDVLIRSCTGVASPAGWRPLDEQGQGEALARVEDLSGQGLRVLAVAGRRLDPGDPAVGGSPEQVAAALEHLTLELLAGILDPPRSEARDAIGRCHRAGIEVKMITGDHAATASAIAASLGIRGRTITGAELDALDDAELGEAIGDIGVCARVSPQHKVRLVSALQARGDVVAMTGDGVNDAAALRRADIGVAMGVTGTEVTKEAGDLILTDDNFATIVTAVERGRTVYENIVTFVRFQVTTNLAAIVTIVAAGLAGLPTPFTPVQVLFVNLIADGPPAMSLGVDPTRPGTMERPPRRVAAPILSARRLARLFFLAIVMAAGTLGVLAVAEEEVGRDVALTMTFSTFVLFQLLNAFNARSERGSVFSSHLFTNPRLWLALGAVALIQVAVVHLGFLQSVFDTTSLSPAQWAVCAGVAVTVLVAEELRKVVTRLIRG
jgi:Ca2+-transporting ATPase